MITIKLGKIRIKFRRRLIAPVKTIIITRILAVLIALGLDSILLLSYNINPCYAYYEIVRGSILSWYGITEVVVKFIPLALCSYGLILVFKAGVWNIGSEGQLLLGAIAATWIALFTPYLPASLMLPAIYIIGFIAGALWALIPAFLKVSLGVNEILTTFMLNLVAEKLLEYFVYGPWRGAHEWGFPQTSEFPPQAQLPYISGTRIHYTTLLLAIFFGVLLYIIDRKTILGYEIRVIGNNLNSAKYAGINIWKVVLISMIISGGLSGIAGVGEVAGIQRRLKPRISPGYGYIAIVTTWLGNLNPIGVSLATFFYSILLVGGDMLQVSLGLPAAIINIFNGSILLVVAGIDIITKYKILIER